VETPLLVSRFYRAPEIVLGLKYDFSMDMFSYGCCLFEFSTGDTLFKSKNNNEHLRMIMEIRGMFPKKMLTKGKFTLEHFDENFRFLEHIFDPVSKKEIVQPKMIAKPSRNITKELIQSFNPTTDREKDLVRQLSDLIDKCLTPDPNKRLTPEEALLHPLFSKRNNIINGDKNSEDGNKNSGIPAVIPTKKE